MQSQPDISVLDALVEPGVEPHKRFGQRVVEIDRIADGCRVEAFAHQIDFLLLEGRCYFELALDPHEYRPRVVRQVRAEVCIERRKIAGPVAGDRRHPGAPVAAGYGDAIDIRVLDPTDGIDGFRDLGRRYGLTLPAE